jgi:hypothetical protein
MGVTVLRTWELVPGMRACAWPSHGRRTRPPMRRAARCRPRSKSRCREDATDVHPVPLARLRRRVPTVWGIRAPSASATSPIMVAAAAHRVDGVGGVRRHVHGQSGATILVESAQGIERCSLLTCCFCDQRYRHHVPRRRGRAGIRAAIRHAPLGGAPLWAYSAALIPFSDRLLKRRRAPCEGRPSCNAPCERLSTCRPCPGRQPEPPACHPSSRR